MRTGSLRPGSPGYRARSLRARRVSKCRRTCRSGDFGDFVRPDAPRAGVDPTVAAAHFGPDTLQVRLETPRADVMSVAEGTAHNRGLSTNFATIRHVGCNPSADLLWAGFS